MLVVYILGAILVAGGQPGSAAWYQKKADDAVAKAQSANRAEALRLIEEMRKTADAQGSQDWKLWVEWKKGLCEYSRRPEPSHRDLGEDRAHQELPAAT
jgi:hypothetical protein